MDTLRVVCTFKETFSVETTEQQMHDCRTYCGYCDLSSYFVMRVLVTKALDQ
jgi:hypothetical protein